MKKIIIITAMIFGSTAIAEESNKYGDPPGIFDEIDCVRVAVELYDELVNQEIDRETASDTAFMVLLECEEEN